ncbi:MAG: Vitamin B12 dependent methionine synthase activation subunit [Clostridia bacterium]|nr:Vitamin B12 dependent methionine synthase activation subunit [Clostridia bacterium]
MTENTVYKKTYSQPPVDIGEILRYCGCTDADDGFIGIVQNLLDEATKNISYKVCYRFADIKIQGNNCDLGFVSVESADLAKNLKDCNRIILFAATVGIEIDRLIAKYSKISPSKAVIMQAIGAERIEALCDTFCKDMANQFSLKPRFSAGYGDLPLEIQKDIFAVLDCSKQIGLTLNNSMLMSPTKSVTAITGIINTDTGANK